MVTTDYEQALALARQKISQAKGVLIGAGAGLSTSAGLDYSGSDFKKAFADYIQKYGFADLYTSSFYEFNTEEERWARWARHVDYARFKPPPMPLYKTLFQLVMDKQYFVITTNVDGQFLKAGFDPLKIFAVQGDYAFMQCAHGCHSKVYPNREVVEKILCQSRNLTIPSSLVPHCPVCADNMDIHVRKNHFFVEDVKWQEAARRYENFIGMHRDAALVLLELGVGFNTPSIIRYPFEHIAWKNPNACLIRINMHNTRYPQKLEGKAIVFDTDIVKVVDDLVQKVSFA